VHKQKHKYAEDFPTK